MAKFGNVTLTNGGRGLISRIVAGQQLRFSRIVTGDGVLPDGQDPAELTELISPKWQGTIVAVTPHPEQGKTDVQCVMSNEGLTEFFLLREVGLLAIDPETQEELLYGYATTGPDQWDYIPAFEGPDPLWYRWNMSTIIGQAEVLPYAATDPGAVSFADMEKNRDEILIYIQARENFLQEQIDHLAEASIIKSLNYAEGLLQGEEA